MAMVRYSHLCRGLKKDEKTGRFSPRGSFHSLAWTDSPVPFTVLVYWTGQIRESFRQSFTLVDEAGHVLDEMPEIECVLTSRHDTIGAAYFYAVFPSVGAYFINIYQNGICVEGLPVHVMDGLASGTMRNSSLQ